MSDLQICLCGRQAGYGHMAWCPYPLYKATQEQEDAWKTASHKLITARPPCGRTRCPDCGALMEHSS